MSQVTHVPPAEGNLEPALEHADTTAGAHGRPPGPDPADGWLTADELAAYAGRPVAEVLEAIRRRVLPAVTTHPRNKDRWTVRRRDADRWLARD
jgi:hypothetical protein